MDDPAVVDPATKMATFDSLEPAARELLRQAAVDVPPEIIEHGRRLWLPDDVAVDWAVMMIRQYGAVETLRIARESR